jgi:hypothetical protein
MVLILSKTSAKPADPSQGIFDRNGIRMLTSIKVRRELPFAATMGARRRGLEGSWRCVPNAYSQVGHYQICAVAEGKYRWWKYARHFNHFRTTQKFCITIWDKSQFCFAYIISSQYWITRSSEHLTPGGTQHQRVFFCAAP